MDAGTFLGVGAGTWGGRAMPAARAADRAGEQGLFGAAMARASGGEDTPEARAREGAEQLVAAALISPVLKMMREGNQAAAPFAPSSGERSFLQVQDAMVAQRLVKRAHWPLVDVLAQRMLAKVGVNSGSERA